MTDIEKRLKAVIEAEYALATARLELAHAFCDMRDPNEVHRQMAAQQACLNRLAALQRLLKSQAGWRDY